MVQLPSVRTSQLHQPVLLREVIEAFHDLQNKQVSSSLPKNELVLFDGTFGRGGHYQALKEFLKPARVLATDQDLQAVQFAKENFPEVEIHHQSFLEFAQQNQSPLDGILIDLGVSSPQLDQAPRGFSFNKDGPLDMRMNQSQVLSASSIIATWPEADLEQLFREYGEVPNPRRVVRAILQDRETQPFTTTLQLASLIERVDGWTKKGFHPATQYFMALRLVVNRELENVEQGLPLLIEKLQDGGRMVIITFHSLEDRLVKNILKDSTLGFMVNKKVIVPSEQECQNNPRARSAKLRIFQKGLPPEKPDKFALRRAQRADKA